MKHTPGPWIAEQRDSQTGTWDIRSADYGGIVTLHDPYRVEIGMSKQIERDAHLIAAAPELLEALKALTDTITERDRYTHEATDAAYRLAIAAIAKAEGRES